MTACAIPGMNRYEQNRSWLGIGHGNHLATAINAQNFLCVHPARDLCLFILFYGSKNIIIHYNFPAIILKHWYRKIFALREYFFTYPHSNKNCSSLILIYIVFFSFVWHANGVESAISSEVPISVNFLQNLEVDNFQEVAHTFSRHNGLHGITTRGSD